MCDHVMGQQGTGVSMSASLARDSGEMWISMNADGTSPISWRCSQQCFQDDFNLLVMVTSQVWLGYLMTLIHEKKTPASISI
jgi:hypothetical protein